MKVEDFFWMVGILEGEGCFMHGPPSRPNRPIIAIQMTDEDVVKRVASLIGTRVWCDLQGQRGRLRPWKPTFKTVLGGSRAVALMKEIAPHMGSRRRSKIEEIILEYIPRLPGHRNRLVA
jgi:hypothetical protein